jgi:hypothetical protein
MALSGALTITLPEVIMAEVEKLAQKEQRTPIQIVQEAVTRLLADKKLQELYAFGESQARNLGISEGDVPELVKQVRREFRELDL